MQQTPHPPQGAGFFVLQLTVVKEDGGQLHQIAEAEIDHIQRADPVEGEGGLAVGEDSRAQQQEDQQPVGGIGEDARLQGVPALWDECSCAACRSSARVSGRSHLPNIRA